MHTRILEVMGSKSPVSKSAIMTVGFQESPPNPALNLVRFAHWTLRDKAAQRRLVLRSTPNGRDKMNPIQNKPKRPGAISPADFFSKDSEKTKLNWFLFEFAAEIQSQIGKPLKKRLQKGGIYDGALAAFCIHYSKSMKTQILQQVAGRQTNIHHSYLPIEQYFSSLSDKLVDDLLTAVGNAWNEQTDMCVVCPTRCISEKDHKADMFDDPDYYD